MRRRCDGKRGDRQSRRSRRRGREGRGSDRQTERGLQQPLLLFDQELHGALGGVLPVEKLAVQLRRLILHALQSGQTVPRQVQRLGESGSF